MRPPLPSLPNWLVVKIVGDRELPIFAVNDFSSAMPSRPTLHG